MSRRRGRSIIIQLAGSILIAGIIVLGILQVRWVSKASSVEEVRIRRNLIMETSQALRDSSDEIQVLLSLVNIDSEAYMNASFDEMIESIQFWRETAPFPELLKEVYILPAAPDKPVLLLSHSAGAFIPVDTPELFLPYLREITEENTPDNAVYRDVFRDLSKMIVVTLPILKDSPAVHSQKGPSLRCIQAMAALLFDEDIFYTKVLPFYLSRHIANYPFRIIHNKSGETLSHSDIHPPERKPDIVLPFNNFFLGATHFASNKASRSADFPADPLVRFWLQRIREHTPVQELIPGKGYRNHSMRLEIFHPEGSIESIMAIRKVSSLAVSVGILALLLASLIFLYRLYRKTGRLRECEQEFVASMSHELRTPISVIQAASDNLGHGIVREPGKLKRYASVIYEQTERLSRMVESILLYSDLESKHASHLNLVEVDISGLIKETISPLEQLAVEAESRLTVNLESLPAAICTDPTAFRRILENLVVNAIRHSNPGEIRLTIGVRVFDTLRITVEDDGPGIPRREQSRVFGAFIRGERSVNEQRPGSGLGLHLVRRMAGLLGGTITLDSPYLNLAEVLKPGCRFTVTLPLKHECLDERNEQLK